VGAEHPLSIIQNGLYRYFLIRPLPWAASAHISLSSKRSQAMAATN
jgi:hypothetical protein